MKIDAHNRGILRKLALEALAEIEGAGWAVSGALHGKAGSRFANAMSPQRVLDLLEQVDALDRDLQLLTEEAILERAAELVGAVPTRSAAHCSVEILRILSARRAAR